MKLRAAIVFCLLSALRLSAGSAGPELAAPTQVTGQRPELAALESRLLELTNSERQRHGLPPLRLSPELAVVARRHSSDMAARNILSHDSSTGVSLKDRLAAAGLYFSTAGENIARSRTGTADLITRKFMESPVHRRNILNPGYDTIGIGAALEGKGVFFVTEDFIARLEVLNAEQSTQKAGQLIQEIRRRCSVPPLVWERKAGALARRMAEARAAGRKPQAVPASFGEAHVLSVMTPRLDGLSEYADEIGRPDYQEAGLGVAFSRPREDPGGAYFIVLVLLPEVRQLRLTDRERRDVVIAALNARRQGKGLRPLVWRSSLARIAYAMSGGLGSTRDVRVRVAESGGRASVYFYETVDLEQLSPELGTWILDPMLVGIGLRIVFEKTGNFPRGAYRVTVVVE